MGPGVSPWQVVRSLKTKSKAEAVARFHLESGKVQREAEAKRRDSKGMRIGRRTRAEDQGRYWAEQLSAAKTPDEAERIEENLHLTIEDILGDPVDIEVRPDGREEPVYDPARERRALTVSRIAQGKAVPVSLYFEDFISGRSDSARYVYRFRRAITLLEEWLGTRPELNNTRAVTDVTAVEFLEYAVSSGLTRRTALSFKSALNVYWDWLGRRGLVKRGVWKMADLRRAGTTTDKKRGFTDEEVAALLAGDASPILADMMRVAALSGMRLNEIANLRVGHCAGGLFRVEEGKTENAARAVPIHSDLKKLVARRSAGKSPDDYLMDGLKAPPSRGERGRGDKLGERFTAYRRSLGVDPRRPGRRQGEVDFHSFRRWFATKAERAGMADTLISAVLGHSVGRRSLAMSVYSDGPELAQWRAVVESVRLPG